MNKYTYCMAVATLGCTALCGVQAHAADDSLPPFSPAGNFWDSGKFIHSDGATLYRAVCQGCHMSDARGAQGAGAYPALAENPKLASAAYAAVMVLRGRRAMPPFADFLSDAQVAAVVNFVRSHFGNAYADAIGADEVQRLRASSEPEKAP